MIKEIIKDPIFLSQKSEKATKDDIQTVNDLLDTIKANSERCVGMAANMIGVRKTILVALIGGEYRIMINPEIFDKSKQTYETNEGCLSHIGEKTAKRYKSITVIYLDNNFKLKKQTFYDFEAQIIQHEMDHFSGILI